MKEKIIFIAGVSGSGKTTVINELLLSYSNLVLVPSYVTRSPRPNEKNGRKYWFISQEEFNKAKDAGEFLEYAEYAGNSYGTKLKDIESVITRWMIAVKEIEMVWFQKIVQSEVLKDKFISFFFDIPESLMISRITSRAPIGDEELAKRLESARKERLLAEKLCTYHIDTSTEVSVTMRKVNAIIKELVS